MTYKKAKRATDIYHLISGEMDIAEDSGNERFGTTALEEFKSGENIHIEGKLIPFHAVDSIRTGIVAEEVERTDPYCGDGGEPVPPTPGEITFTGIPDWLEINAGKTADIFYDTRTGVKAYEDGVEIPFEVFPELIQVCQDEEGSVVYSAKGVTEEITYHVYASVPPTIFGVHDIHVGVGDTFEPLAGVTAQSSYGDDLEVRCDAPHIYHEAGEYLIMYMATDKCGNVAGEGATVYVTADEELKTVLYDDGTFVINQPVSQIIEEQVVKEYPHLDDDNPYIFNGANERPWHHESQQIRYVSFGSPIAPQSMAHWFANCRNVESIGFDGNFDGSKCVSLRAAFAQTGLETLSLPEMPNLQNIRYMCYGCTAMSYVYLDQVNTNKIIDTTDAFQGARNIETADLTGLGGRVQYCERMFANINGQSNYMSIYRIYATDALDFSQALESSNMFRCCNQLSGAIPFDPNYTDKTYANLQGYFTAK